MLYINIETKCQSNTANHFTKKLMKPIEMKTALFYETFNIKLKVIKYDIVFNFVCV